MCKIVTTFGCPCFTMVENKWSHNYRLTQFLYRAHAKQTKDLPRELLLRVLFGIHEYHSGPPLINLSVNNLSVKSQQHIWRSGTRRLHLWVRTGLQMRYTHMMTSSNGNTFRATGPLCGEFTGHRWIPRTKASDAELWCFLWSAPE